MNIPISPIPDNPGRMSCAQVELIDIKQVSAMLGLSERMAYRRVRDGDMPPLIAISRGTHWRVEALNRWLRNSWLYEKVSAGSLAGLRTPSKVLIHTFVVTLQLSDGSWIIKEVIHEA